MAPLEDMVRWGIDATKAVYLFAPLAYYILQCTKIQLAKTILNAD